jgi:hypothetical protein
MNTKVRILFLLVAIVGTVNIAPTEAKLFRKLFTSRGQLLPPGTFQTCDAMIQYAQSHSPLLNPQCSEIIFRPCCDECTYDQQNPSCHTCGKMQLYSNIQKLQAMGCLTPPPTRSNRRLRSYRGNLIDLAKSGSISKVRAILKKGANINQVDEDGKTALSWACIQDDLAMVRFLLNQNANPNKKDYLGSAPLFYAVAHANYKVVRRLLSAPGIDVNTENESGETPLAYAVIYSVNDYCVTGDKGIIGHPSANCFQANIRQLLRHPNIDVNMEVTIPKFKHYSISALTIAEKFIYVGFYTTIYTPIIQMLEDAGGTSFPLCKRKMRYYRCDRV